MSDLNPSVDCILKHLKALVAFDTQNPPRDIQAEGEIFEYFQKHLPGFSCQIFDNGNGSISLLAERGQPDLLFNFHIDTVPANELWERDPFSLKLEKDRVFGLGACDIKGASACMLAAVNQVQGDVALLFSSDEEAGNSTCIREYLKLNRYQKVVVSEPTQAQAVTAHRGIGTASIEFNGVPGHASAARALSDSAIHRSGLWINEVVKYTESSQTDSFENLNGVRMNIGRIEGGIKPNMIAGSCELKIGVRSLPAQNPLDLLGELVSLAKPHWVGHFQPGFVAPALPANASEHALTAGKNLAKALDLPLGAAVDFWTEASLFSEAGCAVIVYGPGDIAQAHTADEWVLLSQLDTVFQNYCRILSS